MNRLIGRMLNYWERIVSVTIGLLSFHNKQALDTFSKAKSEATRVINYKLSRMWQFRCENYNKSQVFLFL